MTSAVPSNAEALLLRHHLSPGPACLLLHHKRPDSADTACVSLAVELPAKRSPNCSALPGKITWK